jgi:hypothetical protein
MPWGNPASDREKAAEIVTRFRWAIVPNHPQSRTPENIPLSFSAGRAADEAQWLNAHLTANLPRHFPRLRWKKVQPIDFRGVQNARVYYDLVTAHCEELRAEDFAFLESVGARKGQEWLRFSGDERIGSVDLFEGEDNQ